MCGGSVVLGRGYKSTDLDRVLGSDAQTGL